MFLIILLVILVILLAGLVTLMALGKPIKYEKTIVAITRVEYDAVKQAAVQANTEAPKKEGSLLNAYRSKQTLEETLNTQKEDSVPTQMDGIIQNANALMGVRPLDNKEN